MNSTGCELFHTICEATEIDGKWEGSVAPLALADWLTENTENFQCVASLKWGFSLTVCLMGDEYSCTLTSYWICVEGTYSVLGKEFAAALVENIGHEFYLRTK